MEEAVVTGDAARSYLGLILGFFIALAVLGCGTFVIVMGFEWHGASLIIVDVIGLAGVFVYGTNSRRRERELKAMAMPRQLPDEDRVAPSADGADG